MNDRLDRLADKRVLVTGGRGFIGKALCRKLNEIGAKVWTVGRSPHQETSNGGALVADLQSIDAARQVLEVARPDYVMHLASHVVGTRSPEAVLPTFHNNLTTTVNLLVAAAEHKCTRVLLTGSLEEPSPSGDWAIPSSPYAAAKLAAGDYGRMFNTLFSLPVVMLRVFMVYGPDQGDDKKLVPYVITSLLQGETPTFTSGQREVDWIYVDDVADAYLHAAVANGIEGDTIDIGTGRLGTVQQIVESLFKLMGASEPPQFGSVQDRPMEQIRCADVGRTRKLVDWTATTSLEAGLRKTIDWYRSRN